MKYVALLAALGAALAVSSWMQRSLEAKRFAFICAGFLPFGLTLSSHFDLALLSWQGWPGYVTGFEVTIFDVMLIALYSTSPKINAPRRFLLPLCIYAVFVFASAFQTDTPVPSFFYCWQLVRIILVYLIIERLCTDVKVIAWILTGMSLGLCQEATVVIWQRFGQGAIQASGTFSHQNLLGMMSHFVTFPLWSLLLAGQVEWLTTLGLISALIVTVFGASRATLGLFSFGMAFLLGLSSLRRPSSKKFRLALVSVLIVALFSPVILSTFARRFAEIPLSDEYDERAAFEAAAASMLSTYPLGVGANTFVVVANTKGFYDEAKVSPNSGSRSAHVHNVYWLTVAELGYMGLAAFIVMLLVPLRTAFRLGWQTKNDVRGDLLLGLGTALLIVYIHGLLEWVFVLPTVQYLFAINLGMISGLVYQLSLRRPSKVAVTQSNMEHK